MNAVETKEAVEAVHVSEAAGAVDVIEPVQDVEAFKPRAVGQHPTDPTAGCQHPRAGAGVRGSCGADGPETARACVCVRAFVCVFACECVCVRACVCVCVHGADVPDAVGGPARGGAGGGRHHRRRRLPLSPAGRPAGPAPNRFFLLGQRLKRTPLPRPLDRGSQAAKWRARSESRLGIRFP